MGVDQRRVDQTMTATSLGLAVYYLTRDYWPPVFKDVFIFVGPWWLLGMILWSPHFRGAWGFQTGETIDSLHRFPPARRAASRLRVVALCLLFSGSLAVSTLRVNDLFLHIIRGRPSDVLLLGGGGALIAGAILGMAVQFYRL